MRWVAAIAVALVAHVGAFCFLPVVSSQQASLRSLSSPLFVEIAQEEVAVPAIVVTPPTLPNRRGAGSWTSSKKPAAMAAPLVAIPTGVSLTASGDSPRFPGGLTSPVSRSDA
jgi:hypothetical protein